MAKKPKEIWVDYEPYCEGYAEVSETENGDTKYIREDESKAREKAARKRGLEEAAEIAENANTRNTIYEKARRDAAAAIRAKIQENDG